jgi:hypothetical protein
MDNQEYVTLIFGCGKEKVEHVIDLHTTKIDKWNQNRVKALGFKMMEVSAVVVGPRTVFEFYQEDNFQNQKGRVINNTSDKKRVYRFGCKKQDHEIWRGSLNSFIIYTWNFFDSIYGTRFCSNDRDCKVNEMCLCPTGASHPANCYKSGRRCRSKGYFWYESPPILLRDDQIDMSCFNEQMKKLESTGLDNNNISNALLEDISRRCAKEKLETIEPFSSVPVTSGTIFIIIMIICILFPIGLFL